MLFWEVRMDIKDIVAHLERVVTILGGNAVLLRSQFSPVSKAAEGDSIEELKGALIAFEAQLGHIKGLVVEAYLLWEQAMNELAPPPEGQLSN